MITAAPNTFLHALCHEVDNMKPGEAMRIDGYTLRHEISGFHHNGALFTPADRVLGNIVGSAYTHSYTVDPMSGDVTFRRHEDTGERRYSDPDRRREQNENETR